MTFKLLNILALTIHYYHWLSITIGYYYQQLFVDVEIDSALYLSFFNLGLGSTSIHGGSIKEPVYKLQTWPPPIFDTEIFKHFL